MNDFSYRFREFNYQEITGYIRPFLVITIGKLFRVDAHMYQILTKPTYALELQFLKPETRF